MLIKETREGVNGNGSRGRSRSRVSKAMLSTYSPQILSLGPYHHQLLKDESVGPYHHRLTHLSQMESYKTKFNREASDSYPNLIQALFTKIIESNMIDKLEEFYDLNVGANRNVVNIGWMMCLDALFLNHFLKTGFNLDGDNATITTEEESINIGRANKMTIILVIVS
ncbi:hypothetical protein KI387_027985, partial [Taxus chinensis]